MVAVDPSQDDAGRTDEAHLRKGVLIWLFVFSGIVGLACASYIWLKVARPGVLQRIGSSAEPPEVVTEQAAVPATEGSLLCER